MTVELESTERPVGVKVRTLLGGGRAVATLFRTSTVGNSTYVFRPRGLDSGKNYRVMRMNSGQTVEVPVSRLLSDGIPVRIENPMGSEMLIFEGK